ncbi:MAG: D-alanyl-D-alanine carboxypeptidase/D-alanyl-D-alanine-endopeptidase [Armatimonadetes bacterium]|nr:D-alanyl-D-alanine carboxypeptidase/D-alanyl-D-alanine-endopeptidase [Armatimonadota bacterium]
MVLTPLVALIGLPAWTRPLDAPKLKGAMVCALVTKLDGTILFARNIEQRVMPASNQKLFSCAFALNMLGPDTAPETKIWVANGQVTIDAPGDPSMTAAKLEKAAKSLGLTGNLPVQVREAYNPGWADTWQIGDAPNRYGAAVSALTVDQGAFEIWAENGKAFLLPRSYGVEITLQPDDKAPRVDYDPFRSRLIVKGKLPDKKTRLDTLSLPNPTAAAASYFGTYSGPTTGLPASASMLVIKGDTIGTQIASCLKPSDNNMAENLLLMGAAKLGPLGENAYATARERINAWLEKEVGVDPNDLGLRDGSGLSRQDITTVRAINKLLRYQAKQPTFPLWRAALAKPGEDGTLRTRLKGVPFEGKTGSLTMVIALSGYVKRKNGELNVVSVIVNHANASSNEVRAAIDDFVKNIAELP